MPSQLVLQSARHLMFEEYHDVPLQSGEVRARAVVSGLSHGTEMNLYRGTSPFDTRWFDPDLRLFRERQDVSSNALYPGYDWVGRVTEVGPAVTDYQVGDLIHLPFPHRETHTFSQGGLSEFNTSFAPLPAALEPEKAIFLMLAGVALQAVHDAYIKVGDRVAIFGLGAIGLLAGQLARLNGAGWVDAVDLYAPRRELALRLGADRALDPAAQDAGYEIKAASDRHGADVAIELSGSYRALHDAIRSVGKSGTVVAGGFYYGDASGLRLGEEFHHNRVTLISTMGVWGNPHRDHPLWDRDRIHATAARLLAANHLRTEGMITHRIPFRAAPDAYARIEQHPEQVIKIVLTY